MQNLIFGRPGLDVRHARLQAHRRMTMTMITLTMTMTRRTQPGLRCSRVSCRVSAARGFKASHAVTVAVLQSC